MTKKIATSVGQLAGISVLNTRAKNQAEELSVLLRAHGADVIELPMLEILPPQTWDEFELVARDLKTSDWFLFTSSNGVKFTAEFFKESFPKNIAVTAIGEKTADTARSLGFKVEFVSKGVTSEDFARELVSCVKDKPRIHLFRADIATEVLPDILREAGFLVNEITAYRSLVPEISKPELKEALENTDMIILTSSQAVRNLFNVTNEIAEGLLAKHKLAVIGVKTAATVKELGLKITIQSDKPELDSLVESLIEHL